MAVAMFTRVALWAAFLASLSICSQAVSAIAAQSDDTSGPGAIIRPLADGPVSNAPEKSNGNDQTEAEKSFSVSASITRVLPSADSSAFNQALDDLTKLALQKNPMTGELDKKVDSHKGVAKAVWKKTKDSLNFAFFIRGDGPSSDAGDIILDEKLKIHDKPSADYARQRLADRVHMAVVSQVLQLAEGVGNSDKDAGREQITSSMANLRELVGDDGASRVLDVLTEAAKTPIDEKLLKRKPWSISQRQTKIKQIIEASVGIDPVINSCKDKVHKFNHHSRKYVITTKIVKTSLGLAALTPSIVGTAASISEYAFIMATGGPEEDKIIKELYLDKCIQSHGNVLTEKAHMALDGYQLARFTNNPALLFCAESLIGQMTGPEALATVLDKSEVAAVSPEKSGAGAVAVKVGEGDSSARLGADSASTAEAAGKVSATGVIE